MTTYMTITKDTLLDTIIEQELHFPEDLLKAFFESPNVPTSTFEKLKLSSSFNNLTKSISAERYNYYFTFSPGWFGLRLGFFSKSKFKSSLILKSRYNSNVFSKFGQTIFSKLFYSKSLVIDRFKTLQENKNIHQTNIMMDLVSKSGIAINRKTQTNFIFTNFII